MSSVLLDVIFIKGSSVEPGCPPVVLSGCCRFNEAKWMIQCDNWRAF